MNPVGYYVFLRRVHGYSPRMAFASVLMRFTSALDMERRWYRAFRGGR